MIHLYDLVETLENGTKRLKCRDCIRQIKVKPDCVEVEYEGEHIPHSWSITWTTISSDIEIKCQNL